VPSSTIETITPLVEVGPVGTAGAATENRCRQGHKERPVTHQEETPVTTSPAQETRDYRFLIGLIAGAALGVGLGMLFAPRAAVEFRGRLASSAKSLGKTASDRYEQASARVSAAAKEYKGRGQAIRDNLAEAVVRGAQKVERYATEAKTEHDPKAREHGTP
jgi:gas vesicle protein